MSTILNTNGAELEIPVLRDPDVRVAIITAAWNPRVTHALRDGAIDVLRRAGLGDDRIKMYDVPGTVELVNAAAAVMNVSGEGAVDAVIIIGCVIRGDTPHFDYVCQIAADGCAELNARGAQPLLFGVLTVENLQQALDRAGGVLGNKGAEAAAAALDMLNLHHILK